MEYEISEAYRLNRAKFQVLKAVSEWSARTITKEELINEAKLQDEEMSIVDQAIQDLIIKNIIKLPTE